MAFTFGFASHQLLLRSLLRDRLVQHCRARAVAEFSDCGELAKQGPTLRGADLLIVDSALPGGEALEHAHSLLEKRHVRKVALITDVPGAYLAQRALQLGIHGVLHQRDALECVEGALTTILSGGLYVSPNVCVADRGIFASVLTTREIAVLSLLASGQNPTVVARQLKLSPATVVTHRRNFMKKLGLRSQVGLLLFALRNGMISLGRALGN